MRLVDPDIHNSKPLELEGLRLRVQDRPNH